MKEIWKEWISLISVRLHFRPRYTEGDEDEVEEIGKTPFYWESIIIRHICLFIAQLCVVQ